MATALVNHLFDLLFLIVKKVLNIEAARGPKRVNQMASHNISCQLPSQAAGRQVQSCEYICFIIDGLNIFAASK